MGTLTAGSKDRADQLRDVKSRSAAGGRGCWRPLAHGFEAKGGLPRLPGPPPLRESVRKDASIVANGRRQKEAKVQNSGVLLYSRPGPCTEYSGKRPQGAPVTRPRRLGLRQLLAFR